MKLLIIILIIISVIQYYVSWMTYINWFRNKITYCKMKDSYSFSAMVWFLPFIVWIPIAPIYSVCYPDGLKYLTIKWKL